MICHRKVFLASSHHENVLTSSLGELSTPVSLYLTTELRGNFKGVGVYWLIGLIIDEIKERDNFVFYIVYLFVLNQRNIFNQTAQTKILSTASYSIQISISIFFSFLFVCLVVCLFVLIGCFALLLLK